MSGGVVPVVGGLIVTASSALAQSSGSPGVATEELCKTFGAPPLEYVCNSDLLIQGGDYDCELGLDADLDEIFASGLHRGFSIADRGRFVGPPLGTPGFASSLLLGSGGGYWKDIITDDKVSKEGTIALFDTPIAPTDVTGPGFCKDDGDAALRIYSSETGDFFGWSVDFIDDLDGDLKQEILVGAPRGRITVGAEPKATWRGAAYLFLSSEHDLGRSDSSSPWYQPDPCACPPAGAAPECYVDALETATIRFVATPGLSASPEKPYFGWSVSRAGDLDGDGVGDFAIGAPGPDNREADPCFEPTSPGHTYVISGAAVQALLPATPGTQVGINVVDAGTVLCPGFDLATDLAGDIPGARFGYSLGYSDDVDGDGRPDLIIGAPEFVWRGVASDREPNLMDSFGPGSVRVLPGYDSTAPTFDPNNLPAPYTLTGDWYLDESEYVSECSGLVPQVPCDPGAPNTTSSSYGEAFGFSVEGRFGGVSSGQGCSPGSWDIAVGSPLYSVPATFADGSYKVKAVADLAGTCGVTFDVSRGGLPFLGRATVWCIDDAVTAAAPVKVGDIIGEQPDARLGWELCGFGDWTGDGVVDLAINSRSYDAYCLENINACLFPCFQEATSVPIDDDAGGTSVGAVDVYDMGAGMTLLQRIFGEDSKDSAGMAMARIGALAGDPQASLVLAGARWPGGNEFDLTPPGQHPEIDENGRVYVFRSPLTGP